MLRLGTILHPTDFSPSADQAFQLACALAREHTSRLVVLHVADLPVIPPSGVMTPPPPEGDWEALAAELHKVGASERGIRIEHRMETGAPAVEILRVAADVGCDLIVMGSHGRRGLAHLLMGSVAEQVMRRAPCPVLIAKAPAARERRIQEEEPRTA